MRKVFKPVNYRLDMAQLIKDLKTLEAADRETAINNFSLIKTKMGSISNREKVGGTSSLKSGEHITRVSRYVDNAVRILGMSADEITDQHHRDVRIIVVSLIPNSLNAVQKNTSSSSDLISSCRNQLLPRIASALGIKVKD